VVVRAVAASGKEHGEAIGIQAELFRAEGTAFDRAEHLEVRARLHQVTAYARIPGWNPALHRVIARGGRARHIEVDTRLDPVARIAPAAGKFAAVSGAPYSIPAQGFSGEREITAVQAVVDAENEMSLYSAGRT
jgi:hypothetical protein